VKVVPNQVFDLSSNPNTNPSNSLHCVFDNNPPSVVFTSTFGNPSNLLVMPINASFTEKVSPVFNSSDPASYIVARNSQTQQTLAIGNFKIMSTLVWSFEVTAQPNEVFTITLLAGVAQDATGLKNAAVSQTWANDLIPPTVSITTPENPVARLSAPVTFIFSEPIREALSASHIDVVLNPKDLPGPYQQLASSAPTPRMIQSGRRLILQQNPPPAPFSPIPTRQVSTEAAGLLPFLGPITGGPRIFTSMLNNLIAGTTVSVSLKQAAVSDLAGNLFSLWGINGTGTAPTAISSTITAKESQEILAAEVARERQSLKLVVDQIGPVVNVSTTETLTAMSVVSVFFVWDQELPQTTENAFTSADVIAINQNGDAVTPLSLLHSYTHGDKSFSEFTLEFSTKGIKTLTVWVRENATFDEAGNPNEKSNVLVVRVVSRASLYGSESATLCGDVTCQYGVCDNGACICDDGYEHEKDWFFVNDCSVPIQMRRGFYIASAVVAFFVLIFTVYRLMRLPKESHAHRILQQAILVIVITWAALRVAWFIFRLFVATFSVIDSVLLALPMAFTYPIVGLVIEVYASEIAQSSIKPVARGKDRKFLIGLGIFNLFALPLTIAPDTLFEAFDVVKHRIVFLTVGMGIHGFSMCAIIITYTMLLRQRRTRLKHVASRVRSDQLIRMEQTLEELDSVYAFGEFGEGDDGYEELKNSRRKQKENARTPGLHAQYDPVAQRAIDSLGSTADKLFVFACLYGLLILGLVLSPMTFMFVLVGRWVELLLVIIAFMFGFGRYSKREYWRQQKKVSRKTKAGRSPVSPVDEGEGVGFEEEERSISSTSGSENETSSTTDEQAESSQASDSEDEEYPAARRSTKGNFETHPGHPQNHGIRTNSQPPSRRGKRANLTAVANMLRRSSNSENYLHLHHSQRDRPRRSHPDRHDHYGTGKIVVSIDDDNSYEMQQMGKRRGSFPEQANTLNMATDDRSDSDSSLFSSQSNSSYSDDDPRFADPYSKERRAERDRLQKAQTGYNHPKMTELAHKVHDRLTSRSSSKHYDTYDEDTYEPGRYGAW